MAASYKIFKDIELIILTVSGPANLKEVFDMLKRLQSDADFSISYNALWDATGRTVPFTSEEIRELVHHVGIYKGDKRPKRAFLVSKDVIYGMLRVYESFRSSISHADIEIFKDRNEALKWLGLQDHSIIYPKNDLNNN